MNDDVLSARKSINTIKEGMNENNKNLAKVIDVLPAYERDEPHVLKKKILRLTGGPNPNS